jgi:endonuclease/exonuclease/phosphatase family metal-dependent hydrolase
VGRPPSVRRQLDQLESLQPDVACLSEAPFEAALEKGWRRRNNDWHFASVENDPFSGYWYRLTVMSRFPVSLRREWDLSTGHAALFDVELPVRALHVLMVDLQSSIFLPRSSTIREAAQIVAAYAQSPAPIDLVLGDFNTPGHFIGFDALAATGPGYRRAAMWSGQWRATWPSRLPLSPLDIDHVWVRNGLHVAGAKIFSTRVSDHRGQLTELRLQAHVPIARTAD